MLTHAHSRIRSVLLAESAALYVAFLLYMVVGLRFNLFQSDPLTYWQQSFEWRAPFGTWWVPGYPLTIAVVRWLTRDALPPLGVMWIIAGASYLVAVYAMYSLAEALHVRRSHAAALLFAVYPFVGLTYSVYPIADTSAMALVLLSILGLEQRRYPMFLACSAASLVVHKATWFFIPPLLLVSFIRDRDTRALLPLVGLPLVTWIVAGAFYHHDALWFLGWSVNRLVRSQSSLPVLDGLVGPLLSGSPAGITKGLVVVTTFFAAGVLAYRCFRLRFWSGLCVSVSVVLLCVTINSYEIWSAVRFSRLLVVPLAYCAFPPDTVDTGRTKRLPVAWLLGASVLTNLLYGVYFTRFF